MKVKDLIEQLKKQDQDLECVFAEDQQGLNCEFVIYFPITGRMKDGRFYVEDLLSEDSHKKHWKQVVRIN